MGWVIVRKSSDQCQMQPLSEALCKIYKEYFRDFVRNSRIFSVQFYGITSRYPCLKKWCVCLHFLPHSKKIKVYQNWFTLKYCHQVTTDVKKSGFSKWRKAKQYRFGSFTRTRKRVLQMEKPLNKIQLNGQNQLHQFWWKLIGTNRFYQNW